jgi:hypothetical protein
MFLLSVPYLNQTIPEMVGCMNAGFPPPQPWQKGVPAPLSENSQKLLTAV